MNSTIPIELYGYKPNAVANGFFVLVISLCLLASLTVTIATGRSMKFGLSLLFAHAFAIVSYSERLGSWSVGHYIVDNVSAALSPLFLTIGIQICAAKILRVLGREHSLLKPKFYSWITISLVVTAGIIQIVGLIVSFADANLYTLGPLANTGRWVILSGFALQALTMIACFYCLGIVYMRAAKAHRQFGYTTYHKGKGYVPLSPRFKTFLVVLPLAAASMLARCLYRIPFFFGGLKGSVAQNQELYIICEGILLTEAMVLLVVFHPALWLDDGKGTGEVSDQRPASDAERGLDEVRRLILRADAMASPSDAISMEVMKRASLAPLEENWRSVEPSSHYLH